MKTFSEEDAFRAFKGMSRRRFTDPQSGIKPADVCLFVWLVAEAARVNCNPFNTTVTEIFFGFEATVDGELQRIASVGMALNTIKSSLDRLEGLGFVSVDKRAAGKGHKLTVEILME